MAAPLPAAQAKGRNLPWLLRRVFLGMIVTVLVVYGWRAWIGHEQALRRHAANNLDAAVAHANMLSHLLRSADLVLQRVAETARPYDAEGGGLAALEQDLKARAESLPQLRSIFITDAQGRAIGGSSAKAPSLSSHDRRYFLVHRERADAGLYLSEPLRGRLDGAWSLFASRRISGPNGEFLGVAVGLLPVRSLMTLLDPADQDEKRRMTILSLDGTVVATSMGGEDQWGRQLGEVPILRLAREKEMGTRTGSSPLTDDERIVGFRRIPGLQLVVVSSITRREALAQWRLETLANGAVLLLLLGGLLASFVLLERRSRALRDREQHLDTLIEHLPAMVSFCGPDGTFLYANSRIAESFGLKRDQVVGRKLEEVMGEALAARLRPGIERALAGEVVRYERAHHGIPGATLDVTLVPIPGADGKPGGWIALAIDVTGRKRVEESLRQVNRTYAVLSDINQLIVHERDAQVLLASACRIAVERGGFLLAWIGLPDAVSGQLKRVAQAGATEGTLAVVDRVLADPVNGCVFTARALSTGMRAVCNDIAEDPLAASWREAALQRGYASMASFPLTMGGNSAGMAAGTLNLYTGSKGFFDEEEIRLLDELARDIAFALEGMEREAQRVQAVEELKRSEERFRTLIEGASDLITVVGAQGTIRYQSPSSQRVLGHSPGAMASRPLKDFVHPDDLPAVRAAIRRALASPAATVPMEYRVRHADGSWRRLQSVQRSLPGEADGGAAVVNSRDVTERYALEQQLAQAQRLQAVGTLAGGVAHDFNNILGAIVGNADMLRQDLGGAHASIHAVEAVLRAGQRGKELVQRLLAFSRPQEPQLRPVRLAPMLQECERLLRATIPAGVELVFACPPDLPAVNADEAQVHQVVLNLATNAWHALGGRNGRISVRLDACDPTPAFRESHPELRPGPQVRLWVADNGEGMDAATLARIFEPFFTTKPSGQGAGLGLAVVHAIVRGHGGMIEVESQPGAGSSFSVYLPVSKEQPAPVPATAPAGEQARGNGEHILYVDDEEELVYLALMFLGRLGYKVTGHSRADEAIASFRANPRDFDLVVTDLNMPGMSGIALAQQLIAIRPDVRIALATGFLRPAEAERARAAGIQEIILKPSAMDELGALVHRLLQRGPVS